MTDDPPLPEPEHTQVETYSGIAVNKVIETPLFTADQMLDYAAAAVQQERERCAKVCEEYETAHDITTTWQNIIAAAIRAGGRKP